MLTHCLSLQDSDGEKSDDNLVVDVSNEVSMFCQFLLLFFKINYNIFTVVCGTEIFYPGKFQHHFCAVILFSGN